MNATRRDGVWAGALLVPAVISLCVYVPGQPVQCKRGARALFWAAQNCARWVWHWCDSVRIARFARELME